MEEVKDIVERLCNEAQKNRPDCSCVGLHNKKCLLKSLLLFEAAHEIEELRSLIDAMKEGR